jgi:hypothetical protein
MLASLSDVLAHPLFILLIGAFVGSLLIPSITRRWQDRQRALELKAALLAGLSDSVTRIVTHAQFQDMGGKDKLSDEDRVEFDWRYGEWLVESRRLQTQLQAYFASSPDLAKHWVWYTELLRSLHELSWQKMDRDIMIAALKKAYEIKGLWTVEARRRRVLGERYQVFAVQPPGDVKWQAFLNTNHALTYMREAWPALKVAMEAPLEPLANAILYADMATFSR